MENQIYKAEESRRWANRLLLISLIGIIYLTCFPFRLEFHGHPFLQRSPFLLGDSLKMVGRVDFILNVLLFVPFGAGLAAQMRKRGAGRGVGLLVALAAGAITSYLVELIQLYIPMRDSGWNDVVSNSLGSVLGFLLFELCGELCLKPMTYLEKTTESCLSLWGTFSILLVYLGFFFVISVPFQKQTRLSDWDPSASLQVGSDGTTRHAWKGQIAKLEIWNHALPDDPARKLTAGEAVPESEPGLLAFYEMTGAPPYSNHEHSLPDLSWISPSQPPQDSGVLVLDGNSWLSTIAPVQDLTRDLARTNQFSIRVVCAPADVVDFERSIISLSKISGIANLTLRQDGPDLFLWVRNPLTEKRMGGFRRARDIYLRNIFEPRRVRDLLVSYDGADVSLYVDGKKMPRVYAFSPGAALVPMFVRFKGSDWHGDLVVYDSLIFLPAGILVGMIARKISRRKMAGRLALFACLVAPPALYEFILVSVSGRAISLWQFGLCLFLMCVGAWLLNADRGGGMLFGNS